MSLRYHLLAISCLTYVTEYFCLLGCDAVWLYTQVSLLDLRTIFCHYLDSKGICCSRQILYVDTHVCT